MFDTRVSARAPADAACVAVRWRVSAAALGADQQLETLPIERRPRVGLAGSLGSVGGRASSLARVKLIRRALTAVGLAVGIAGALRLRGKGGTPPQHGGWQPIELDR